MKTFHEITDKTFEKELNETFEGHETNPCYNEIKNEIKKLFESIYSTREQKIFFLGAWLADSFSWEQIDELRELLGFGKEPPQ